MSIESRSRQYGKVFDHWQIKEFLGQGSGGKSAVFRLTRSDSTWGTSALKVINLMEERGSFEELSSFRKSEYLAACKDCSSKAEQEVRLMDDLQGNTNIVDYLDHTFVDWSDEFGFGRDMLIRMELLKDLRGVIQKGHVFGEAEVLKVGKDICTALVLCHRKNILHRDIKPENIFVNKDGNFKLGDFGVSRILSAAPMAMASTGIGTPEYAAPEQFSGHHDRRVDIYSLGLVLYELGNQNRLPFAESTYARQEDIRRRHMGEPLPAPCNVSPAFAQVILKACAYRAEDRYQTATEFLKALNQIGRHSAFGQAIEAGRRDTNATMKAQPTSSEFETQKAERGNYRTAPAHADREDIPPARDEYSTIPASRAGHRDNHFHHNSIQHNTTGRFETKVQPKRKKQTPIYAVLSIVVAVVLVLVMGTMVVYIQGTLSGKEQTVPDTGPLLESSIGTTDNFQSILFQGKEYPADTTQIEVSFLSEGDVVILDSFPNLKILNASDCSNYGLLATFQKQHPQCQVIYSVDLGGKNFDVASTDLVLEAGECNYESLLSNLQYLPQLKRLTLKSTALSIQQVQELRETYENITVEYTVEILGTEYNSETTHLDLSEMASTDLEQISSKLQLLPKLETVELMHSSNISNLQIEDVQQLCNILPDVSFHYVFDFKGKTISTRDKETIFNLTKFEEEEVEELRTVLAIMNNGSRFVLDGCNIPNETLAQLREESRKGANLVWRVYFGADSRFNVLTDAEVIRAVFNLTDETSGPLRYCEGAKYVDVGHNETLTDLSFVSGMPELEVFIGSGSAVEKLRGFENSKKLVWLELANCLKLETINALESCENLTYLNISNTQIKDYQSLDELPLERFMCVRPRASGEAQRRFEEIHRGCMTTWSGNEYGRGWRYDDNGETYNDYYQNVIRKAFDPYVLK